MTRSAPFPTIAALVATLVVVEGALVLHATGDIRESLRNAKALLGGNGLLVLNELASCELWSHLTFGLLDGWWLYRDEALRIPGCPSLTPARWAAVLGEEGYRHVRFPAERAHHFGLVNVLCEEGGALDAAKELAAQITEAAPLAVRESRKIILEATDQPDEVGWKMSGDGIVKMFGTEDFNEGLTAFIEKRSPVWKGR